MSSSCRLQVLQQNLITMFHIYIIFLAVLANISGHAHIANRVALVDGGGDKMGESSDIIFTCRDIG